MATPVFTTIPRATVSNISVANSNRSDAGSIISVFVAGANGSKIERVIIQAVATTTAGMIRLWRRIGSANFLFKEIPVAAIIPSATLPAFVAEVDFSAPDQVELWPPGTELRASTEKGESFMIHAIGGDFPAP